MPIGGSGLARAAAGAHSAGRSTLPGWTKDFGAGPRIPAATCTDCRWRRCVCALRRRSVWFRVPTTFRFTPTVAEATPQVGYLAPTDYQTALDRLSSWVVHASAERSRGAGDFATVGSICGRHARWA